MKLLKNSTYKAMLDQVTHLENQNRQLNIVITKAARELVEKQVEIKENESNIHKQSDYIKVLEPRVRTIKAEITALKAETKSLRCKLTKAQKNDMPKDKKTGRFTKKKTITDVTIALSKKHTDDVGFQAKNILPKKTKNK